MPGLNSDVDPQGLLEYSVVYTDRAVNHVSQTFQGVMKDISTTLRSVYGAQVVRKRANAQGISKRASDRARVGLSIRSRKDGKRWVTGLDAKGANG